MSQRLAGAVLALLVAHSFPSHAISAAPPDTAATRISQEAEDLAPTPFDSLTAARYRETARKLAAAVAMDDRARFRMLHTDAGWEQTDDWWKAMLANQKKSFGRVVRALGPMRGLVRSGNIGVGIPRDGAAILLLFEKGAGAAMSFTLDRDGKIETSSLWVERWLGSANTDGAEVLWEPPSDGVKNR